MNTQLHLPFLSATSIVLKVARNCAKPLKSVGVSYGDAKVLKMPLRKIHLTYVSCSATDPTIKYFLDGDSKGQDYQGGRDFDSLKSFVEDKLEIKCDVSNPTECSDKEKDYITKMKEKSSEDRVKQIKRLEKMAGESMKSELKTWLNQRLHILRKLEA
jgi:hypothetical protein